MKYKYGEFTTNQFEENKKKLKNQIFFLLLIADPKTKNEYKNIDAVEVFDNTMKKIDGYNRLLINPKNMIYIMSLLEAAYVELLKDEFDFQVYRKLILEAGSEVLKIEEV